MNSRSLRIKDIAQLAGVSVGTVDRVLHNRGKVSEDALKKVLQVLEQIDYKPNLIARTLGANKTYRIAALIPNPDQDPYWQLSKSGIAQAEAEWLRYGVKVMPYFFDLYNKDSFQNIGTEVIHANPDGILVAPIFYHEALPIFKLFQKKEVPYILFNTNIPNANALSFIGQDLFQSGKVGAELMHLAKREQQGILAVLHINEDLDNSVHLAEKEKGFRAYFQLHNITDVEVRTFNLYNPADPTFEKQLSEILAIDKLKGIFISTSKATFITAAVLEKTGKSDIILIGYDMLEENIRYMKKGMIDFLINQNPKRQAFMGIHNLASHLVLKNAAPAHELLPLEIITPENLDSYLQSRIH